MMNWKGSGSGLIEELRHNLPVRLSKTTENLSQDSNRASPEYKSRALAQEQLDRLPIVNVVTIVVFDLMELMPQASRRWSPASRQH
jgi:hypothetical protein